MPRWTRRAAKQPSRDTLRALGVEVLLVDAGCLGEPQVEADAVESGEIASSRYASDVESLDELRKAPDMTEDVGPDSDP